MVGDSEAVRTGLTWNEFSHQISSFKIFLVYFLYVSIICKTHQKSHQICLLPEK